MLRGVRPDVHAGRAAGPFAQMPLGSVIAIIAIAELVLGLMVGFIFSASLYFGMVLSDGSTEHAGYHEALIGVGVVLGPGLASAPSC